MDWTRRGRALSLRLELCLRAREGINVAFLRRSRSAESIAEPVPERRILIRPAAIDDAEAITRMARALSLTDGGRPSRLTVETCRRDGFGPHPAFHAVIADIAGEPVGYAAYSWGYDTDTATRGVYVSDLFVMEACRRCGVGGALMAAIAARCREQGGHWMFWSVLKHNRDGRNFYRTIARELRDVTVCTAYGPHFDRLAERGR